MSGPNREIRTIDELRVPRYTPAR